MRKLNTSFSNKNKEIQVIYGIHSVLAALKNENRRHIEIAILEKYQKLISKYKNKIENIKICTHQDLSKIYGSESVTQGIVLKTSPLKKVSFEKFIEKEEGKNKSIILALDQVTDPQNIGSIMRSCSLFNCNALIVSKDNSPELTSSMVKTASGAAEIVNYIKVVNLKRSLSVLKKNGYWIYGFDSASKKVNKEINFSNKSVLVFGSEGKGIREQVKKECDEIFKIKSKPNLKYAIDSLNVSNATAIALYEYHKKFGD